VLQLLQNVGSSTDADDRQRGRVVKRRRSEPPTMYIKQHWHPLPMDPKNKGTPLKLYVLDPQEQGDVTKTVRVY